MTPGPSEKPISSSTPVLSKTGSQPSLSPYVATAADPLTHTSSTSADITFSSRRSSGVNLAISGGGSLHSSPSGLGSGSNSYGLSSHASGSFKRTETPPQASANPKPKSRSPLDELDPFKAFNTRKPFAAPAVNPEEKNEDIRARPMFTSKHKGGGMGDAIKGEGTSDYVSETRYDSPPLSKQGDSANVKSREGLGRPVRSTSAAPQSQLARRNVEEPNSIPLVASSAISSSYTKQSEASSLFGAGSQPSNPAPPQSKKSCPTSDTTSKHVSTPLLFGSAVTSPLTAPPKPVQRPKKVDILTPSLIDLTELPFTDGLKNNVNQRLIAEPSSRSLLAPSVPSESPLGDLSQGFTKTAGSQRDNAHSDLPSQSAAFPRDSKNPPFTRSHQEFAQPDPRPPDKGESWQGLLSPPLPTPTFIPSLPPAASPSNHTATLPFVQFKQHSDLSQQSQTLPAHSTATTAQSHLLHHQQSRYGPQSQSSSTPAAQLTSWPSDSGAPDGGSGIAQFPDYISGRLPASTAVPFHPQSPLEDASWSSRSQTVAARFPSTPSGLFDDLSQLDNSLGSSLPGDYIRPRFQTESRDIPNPTSYRLSSLSEDTSDPDFVDALPSEILIGGGPSPLDYVDLQSTDSPTHIPPSPTEFNHPVSSKSTAVSAARRPSASRAPLDPHSPSSAVAGNSGKSTARSLSQTISPQLPPPPSYNPAPHSCVHTDRWRLYCFSNAFVVVPNVYKSQSIKSAASTANFTEESGGGAEGGSRRNSSHRRKSWKSKSKPLPEVVLNPSSAPEADIDCASPGGVAGNRFPDGPAPDPPQLILFRNSDVIVEVPNSTHQLYKSFGEFERLYTIDALIGQLHISDARFLVVVAGSEPVCGFSRSSFSGYQHPSQTSSDQSGDRDRVPTSQASSIYSTSPCSDKSMSRTSSSGTTTTASPPSLSPCSSQGISRIRPAGHSSSVSIGAAPSESLQRIEGLPLHSLEERRSAPPALVPREDGECQLGVSPPPTLSTRGPSQQLDTFIFRITRAWLIPFHLPLGGRVGSEGVGTEQDGRGGASTKDNGTAGFKGRGGKRSSGKSDASDAIKRDKLNDAGGGMADEMTEGQKAEITQQSQHQGDVINNIHIRPTVPDWDGIGFGDSNLNYLLGEKLAAYKLSVEKLLVVSAFYYSYDTDITHSLQRKHTLGIPFLPQSWPLQYNAESQTTTAETLSPLSPQTSLLGAISRPALSKVSTSPNSRGHPGAGSVHDLALGVGADDHTSDATPMKPIAASSASEAQPSRREVKFIEIADRRFFWNYELCQPFFAWSVDASWLVPIMQGSICISTMTCGIHGLEVALICRRSCRRSGTRYNHRGIDDEGNVANFCESEMMACVCRVDPLTNQIVSRDRSVAGGGWSSFVQIRGSVPLFWEQSGLAINPAPQLTRELDFAYRAFAIHQRELEALYGDVTYLNLLSCGKNSEPRLTKALQTTLDSYIAEKTTERPDSVESSPKDRNETTVASKFDDRSNRKRKKKAHGKAPSAYQSAERLGGSSQNSLHATSEAKERGETRLRSALGTSPELSNEDGLEDASNWGQPHVKHVVWDFHSQIKAQGFEQALSEFVKSLDQDLAACGCFCEKPVWSDGQSLQFQTGVIRTNCLDCLDRTNAMQWYIAWYWLLKHLSNRGLKALCLPGCRIQEEAIPASSILPVRTPSPARSRRRRSIMRGDNVDPDGTAVTTATGRPLRAAATSWSDFNEAAEVAVEARRSISHERSSHSDTAPIAEVGGADHHQRLRVSTASEVTRRPHSAMSRDEADLGRKLGPRRTEVEDTIRESEPPPIPTGGGAVLEMLQAGIGTGVSNIIDFWGDRAGAFSGPPTGPLSGPLTGPFSGALHGSLARYGRTDFLDLGASGSDTARHLRPSAVWRPKLQSRVQLVWIRYYGGSDGATASVYKTEARNRLQLGQRLQAGAQGAAAAIVAFPQPALRGTNVGRPPELLLSGGADICPNVAKEVIARMWADHGDNISRSYTGTGSVISSLIKQGKSSLSTNVDHVMRSIGRFYQNTFEDAARQDGIDLLLNQHDRLSVPYTTAATPPAPRNSSKLALNEGSSGANASGSLAISTARERVASDSFSKLDVAVRRAESEMLTTSMSGESTLSLGLPRGAACSTVAEDELPPPSLVETKSDHEPSLSGQVKSSKPQAGSLAALDRSTGSLRIWFGSWNLGGRRVNEGLERWLLSDEASLPTADLYVIAIQELVELTGMRVLLSQTDKDKELQLDVNIRHALGPGFQKLRSHSLVGLYLVVFVRENIKDLISQVDVTDVKLGFKGQMGNKGAVLLRFRVGLTTLCFGNVHLASGFDKADQRRAQMQTVVEQAFQHRPAYAIGRHDCILLGGDYNFRCTADSEQTERWLTRGQMQELLYRDQFIMSKRLRLPPFKYFCEPPIAFLPTYKYRRGTSVYERSRTPAWCDRILYAGEYLASKTNAIRCVEYSSVNELLSSDHKPIFAVFQLTVVLSAQVTSPSFGATASPTTANAATIAANFAAARSRALPPQYSKEASGLNITSMSQSALFGAVSATSAAVREIIDAVGSPNLRPPVITIVDQRSIGPTTSTAVGDDARDGYQYTATVESSKKSRHFSDPLRQGLKSAPPTVSVPSSAPPVAWSAAVAKTDPLGGIAVDASSLGTGVRGGKLPGSLMAKAEPGSTAPTTDGREIFSPVMTGDLAPHRNDGPSAQTYSHGQSQSTISTNTLPEDGGYTDTMQLDYPTKREVGSHWRSAFRKLSSQESAIKKQANQEIIVDEIVSAQAGGEVAKKHRHPARNIIRSARSRRQQPRNASGHSPPQSAPASSDLFVPESPREDPLDSHQPSSLLQSLDPLERGDGAAVSSNFRGGRSRDQSDLLHQSSPGGVKGELTRKGGATEVSDLVNNNLPTDSRMRNMQQHLGDLLPSSFRSLRASAKTARNTILSISERRSPEDNNNSALSPPSGTPDYLSDSPKRPY